MSDKSPQSAAHDHHPVNRGIAAWGILFAALVGVRLLFPLRASDTMMVHRAIVDSLLNGHNWGRQALVGAFEYPLLPTLGLLVSRTLVGPRFAGHLLVAFSQVWAFLYLARIRCPGMRRWAYVFVALLFVLALPDMRAAVSALDPNWLAAVPFCSALYHLTRWFGQRELRDSVLSAVNCGLLVFCGPVGLLAGLAILVVLTHDVKQLGRGENARDMRGVPLIVWAPFVYCLLLWLVWNWLVLGDLFFALRPLLGALRSTPAVALPVRGLRAMLYAPASVWGCCALAAAAAWGARRKAALGIVLTALAVVAARALTLALGLFPVGGTLLCICAALAALALAAGTRELSPSALGKRMRLGLTTVGVLLLVAAMVLVRTPDPVKEGAFAAGAPRPQEIVALIDQYWPESRTTVYGVRLPAIYHDPAERRFVARMDYHEDLFLQQASDEVMHLLVPPPDGRFYARKGGVFADIHQHGRPHLLLEKRWRNGWQLWRCVLAPEAESHLRYLE